MPLTPADIRNKQFTTTRIRPGYDEEEVDAFLDEVEAEIDRLIRENEELRSKLAQALQGRSAPAMAAPLIEPRPAPAKPPPFPGSDEPEADSPGGLTGSPAETPMFPQRQSPELHGSMPTEAGSPRHHRPEAAQAPFGTSVGDDPPSWVPETFDQPRPPDSPGDWFQPRDRPDTGTGTPATPGTGSTGSPTTAYAPSTSPLSPSALPRVRAFPSRPVDYPPVDFPPYAYGPAQPAPVPAPAPAARVAEPYLPPAAMFRLTGTRPVRRSPEESVETHPDGEVQVIGFSDTERLLFDNGAEGQVLNWTTALPPSTAGLLALELTGIDDTGEASICLSGETGDISPALISSLIETQRGAFDETCDFFRLDFDGQSIAYQRFPHENESTIGFLGIAADRLSLPLAAALIVQSGTLQVLEAAFDLGGYRLLDRLDQLLSVEAPARETTTDDAPADERTIDGQS
jgi:DivIVA domain-containing protein